MSALPSEDLPSEAVPYDGVLLVSFGGPEGQDDVLPFLRNVTRGRGIPDERLEEVAHHYRAFGGVSPINDQNRALRAALAAELDARGLDLPVLWGNRNWDPFLTDALREAYDAGHRRLLAVVTSAYSSYSSCRQYREDLADALERTGLAGRLTIDKVRQYFDHPGFVTPFVDGVRDALARCRETLAADAALTTAPPQPPSRVWSGSAAGNDGSRPNSARRGAAAGAGGGVHVLFVTHSIPVVTAQSSGPPDRDLGPDGAYPAQHRAVAEVVMARAEAGREDTDGSGSGGSGSGVSGSGSSGSGGQGAGVPWSLVYQSRSGAPTTPWLEPDVNDAITELTADGVRAVVIVPVGFVSDHMEVLWDLDEEAATTARDAGLHVERVPTPGVHPAFVGGLVDLVAERIATSSGRPCERPALTALGPWDDVCRPGCCANPHGERPAVAGLAPEPATR